MASDVAAVLRVLGVARAHLVGWSDGAVVALLLGAAHPEVVAGVLFFACNVDPSGAKPFATSPRIERCLSRHRQDHARLSATPEGFDALAEAVGVMQRTQPDLSRADLEAVRVPVTVVHAEHDEFIRAEHAAYLAASLPRAQLVPIEGVGHFAPVQRPDRFDRVVADFLARRPG